MKNVHLKFACFQCRITADKQTNDSIYDSWKFCPKCSKPMDCVGKKFQGPKKNKIKQWKQLEETWSRFTYESFLYQQEMKKRQESEEKIENEFWGN